MAEIINLRQARKQKARKAREKQAEDNRLKFGRTKSERTQVKAENDLNARRIESHKRDDGERD